MSTDAPTPVSTSERRPRLTDLFSNLELVIAVLLGLVSIVTAYASFQAALYDSQMAGSYTTGQNLSTEAESLYLEANQQYIQDVQMWNRLTELSIDMDSADAGVAASASDKFDTLYFQAVSEDLDAAIQWSAAENEADPATYTSPFDSEDYNAALFSGYAETKDKAVAAVASGDESNTLSDKLTLNTVLMAISLFLLGVSAVVRQVRVQVILMSVAVVIFLVAGVLTATIPFVAI